MSASQPTKGTERKLSIEGELKKLSIGGACLFALLIAALVVIQSRLGSQLATFEEQIVPTERAVGSMLESMGDIAARETAVLAATDHAAVIELGSDAEAAASAKEALAALEGTLKQSQIESLSGEFDAFRSSADDLTDAVLESHNVDTSFGEKLQSAQGEIAQLLSGIGALEGEIELRYILLLRELDTAPSAEAASRLVHGNVRMIDERVSAARSMIEVLGRRIEQVALTRNRDELNSLESNKLAQASASAQSAIRQLRSSLIAADETALAGRVRQVDEQLKQTVSSMRATSGKPGLIDLRHAFFDAQAQMRTAQAAGQERSLSANATLAAVGANVRSMAEATQAGVDRVVRNARIGVAALAIFGLLACVFSGRRVLLALQALHQQNADLAALKDELSEANTHLEARVAERTKELAAREASTRLLLDSMGDGIFEVDARGRLIGERSRAVDHWFGDRLQGDNPLVWKVLTGDPTEEAAIEFGWDQLLEDFLPFEVAADQIPRRFERQGQIFDVEYRQGAAASTVLVIVRDWTANETAERAERENREFQMLVGNLLNDREGFDLTRDECETLLSSLEKARDLGPAKRALHTLKGNTASFGFAGVAEACHSLESRIADEEGLPTASEVESVRSEWEASMDRLKGFLQSDEEDTITIKDAEIEQLRRCIAETRPTDELLRLVSSWSQTPARSYLTRLERQARRIASMLAKDVNVVIRDHGIRVSEELTPLWPALIHLVRNSIDHGLETASVREAAGKMPVGTIELSVEETPDSLVISVADDGGGIDEELLRERMGAAAEGLDLMEVMAQEGLSTKDEVTDVSGRGVGVSAVFAAVEELGGTPSVHSAAGRGTSFEFRFPRAQDGAGSSSSESSPEKGSAAA